MLPDCVFNDHDPLVTQRYPTITPPSYPQVQAPIIDNPALWERLDKDVLFYAFYYQQVNLWNLFGAMNLNILGQIVYKLFWLKLWWASPQDASSSMIPVIQENFGIKNILRNIAAKMSSIVFIDILWHSSSESDNAGTFCLACRVLTNST